MSNYYQLWQKTINLILVLSLALGPECAYAQSAFVSMLPEPGVMVARSSAFVPVLVKGLVAHPDEPLKFDFIVDSGNDSPDAAVIQEQSERIAKYFLAALTVPEDQLWVNLSPYEQDRIIEDELGRTVLGRDMLAQDYVLKQLTASIIYPDESLGKDFWSKIYREAQEKFGTTELLVDTFNKVWIMPEVAEVFEKGNAVYITSAKLKVMLDSDRTAMAHNGSGEMPEDKESLAKAVLREVVIPAIEKEVNEGKNFAVIRQVYHAAILAKWYRELIQNTLLADAYVGKNRVGGVTTDDRALKEQIYQRYIAAYKKGVFNLIKEEADPVTGEAVPRKYFSGGISDFAMKDIPLKRTSDIERASRPVGRTFKVDMAMSGVSRDLADAAMITVTPQQALAYQAEVRQRFEEFDRTAAVQFSPATPPEKVAEAIRRNNGTSESMFQHVQVSRDQALRRIYQEVQGIIREMLGAASPVLEASLDEIHVTIANDDVAPGESLTLTLDQMARDISEDVRGVGSFEIEFVGPHLMPNGVVVMEYTTAAPEFLYLRQKAQERRLQRALSTDNRAFVPNIFHSTVSVIRDAQVPQETLKRLQERLNEYRTNLKPVKFTVDRITATHFRESDRRFIGSRDIQLEVGTSTADTETDAAMDVDGVGKRVQPVSPVAEVQNNLKKEAQDQEREKKKKEAETAAARAEDTVEISPEARALLERDRKSAGEQKEGSTEDKDAAMKEFREFLKTPESIQVTSLALAANLPNSTTMDAAQIPEIFTNVVDWFQNLPGWEQGAVGAGAFFLVRYGFVGLIRLGSYTAPYIELAVLRLKGDVDLDAVQVGEQKEKGRANRISKMFHDMDPHIRKITRVFLEELTAGDQEARYQLSLKGLASKEFDNQEWAASLIIGLGDNRAFDEKSLTADLIIDVLLNNNDERIQQNGLSILRSRKLKGDSIAGRYLEIYVKLKNLLAATSLYLQSYEMWVLIKEAMALKPDYGADYFKYVPAGIGKKPIYKAEYENTGYYDSMTGEDYKIFKRYVVVGYEDVTVPAHVEVIKEIGTTDPAQKSVGGIDIQNIDVQRKEGGARIKFNDNAVRDVLKNGFNGFRPLILNITPVQNPLMILGASESREPPSPGPDRSLQKS